MGPTLFFNIQISTYKNTFTMKWFIKCFKQYADFSSRARRKEYWWFTVINFIIMLIFIIGLMVPIFKMSYAVAMSGGDLEDFNEMEMVAAMLKNPFIYIYLIYYLAVLVPSIAVFVRRMHDIGRSGYWAFLYFGASIIAQIVNMGNYGTGVTIIIAMVLLFITIFFLVWLFTDSQYGPNQWGPNPKGEGNPEEATTGEVQLS